MVKAINVKRFELIDALNNNKKKHVEDYDDAFKTWKEEVIVKLKELLDKFSSDPKTPLEINLPEPVCFVKEYDIAIGMMELEVNEIIEISEQDSRRFFLDQWSWSQSFLSNTMLYKK